MYEDPRATWEGRMYGRYRAWNARNSLGLEHALFQKGKRKKFSLWMRVNIRMERNRVPVLMINKEIFWGFLQLAFSYWRHSIFLFVRFKLFQAFKSSERKKKKKKIQENSLTFLLHYSINFLNWSLNGYWPIFSLLPPL